MCSCESGILLSIILMGRMSLTGHVFVGLGDAVVGLLQGLTALSLTGLAVLPIAQAVFGRRMRRLAVGLLLGGVLLGAAASYSSLWPYSCECSRAALARAVQLAHLTALMSATSLSTNSCVLLCCPAVAAARAVDRPKRLVLAQMHYTEAVPASLAQDATGVPEMRVANSSWVLGGEW